MCRSCCQNFPNGLENRIVRILMTEKFKHQRARPDLSNWISNTLARNIRCRSVHRLKKTRVGSSRIDIARGGYTDGSSAGRTQVRQDVAEKIAGNNNIEPVRMQNEVCGQYVDVKLVRTHVRIIFGHRLHALVPERHGDGNSVRLGGRCQVFFRSL